MLTSFQIYFFGAFCLETGAFDFFRKFWYVGDERFALPYPRRTFCVYFQARNEVSKHGDSDCKQRSQAFAMLQMKRGANNKNAPGACLQTERRHLPTASGYLTLENKHSHLSN